VSLPFLTFAPEVRWVVSTTPRHFNPEKRTPGTPTDDDCTGHRAGLDAEAKRKSLDPAGNLTPVVQPVVHSLKLNELNNHTGRMLKNKVSWCIYIGTLGIKTSLHVEHSSSESGTVMLPPCDQPEVKVTLISWRFAANKQRVPHPLRLPPLPSPLALAPSPHPPAAFLCLAIYCAWVPLSNR
jgi:hypothetical protein